jgi:hypothetical protein
MSSGGLPFQNKQPHEEKAFAAALPFVMLE